MADPLLVSSIYERKDKADATARLGPTYLYFQVLVAIAHVRYRTQTKSYRVAQHGSKHMEIPGGLEAELPGLS